MKILITTFKRPDRQILLKSIPEGLHSEVFLVIQEQEKDLYHEYKNCGVFILPKELNDKGLANTRQFLCDNFKKDSRVLLADDDIILKKRTFEKGKPKFKKLEKEKDWEDFFNYCNETFNCVSHFGLSFSGSSSRSPEQEFCENSRYMTIFGLDLSKVSGKTNFNFIPSKPIWTTSEDLAVNLQLLTLGFKNRILFNYITDPKGWWTKGGCSAYRTNETNDKSLMELKRQFPSFISLREKNGSLSSTISWKKAYLSSKKEKTTLF